MLPVQCVRAEYAVLTCDRSYRTAGVDELKACNIYQMKMSSRCCDTIAAAASKSVRPSGFSIGPAAKEHLGGLT